MSDVVRADRRHITFTPDVPSPHARGLKPPYTLGVAAGNTLYVSGVIDGGPQPGDRPQDAAKRVLDTFKKELEAADATMDDLVWVQVFSCDLSVNQEFNEVYSTYFTGPLPARAMTGISNLPDGATFQVSGVALLPSK